MIRSLLSVLLLGMVAPPASPSLPWQQSLAISVAPPARALSALPPLSASGVAIVDVKSGQQIYGAYADVQRPMASLAKLMTALLIVEHHSLDEWVQVPSDVETIPGNKANILPGERYTVGDLLSATLVYSANDAAEVLARFHSGSQEAFVDEMNRRAAALGLRDTSYANPIGLDDPRQWSTPQDLAWLTVHVQRFPAIRDRMGMKSVTIRSSDGRAVALSHTHALLHADTPIFAGKTGTTDAAGECLVSLLNGADGRQYVVVLLQSRERYADMRTVLDTLAPSSPPAETAGAATAAYGG